MFKFIEEFRWQKRHYVNGTPTYLAYKLGLINSPTLGMHGIKPFFRKKEMH